MSGAEGSVVLYYYFKKNGFDSSDHDWLQLLVSIPRTLWTGLFSEQSEGSSTQCRETVDVIGKVSWTRSLLQHFQA